MARLTKADAARQLGIARAPLYTLISQGKVSPTPDGRIDQTELVRVAPYIDTLRECTRTSIDVSERLQTSIDTPPIDLQEHGHTPVRRLPEDVHEQPIVDVSGRLQTSPDTLVDILREQLRLMQEREREHARLYEERERAYRDHITRLTAMREQAHQQNQRLLDMPRTPLPPQTAQEAPGATQTPAPPPGKRGTATRHATAPVSYANEGSPW